MPQNFRSDQEIIEGCIAGQKEAWEFFVERFSNLVWWSVTKTLEKSRFSADLDLGKDIFQGVFEKLLEKRELEKLREASSLKKFLVVTTSHLALDKIKSASRLQKRELPFEAPEREGDEAPAASPDAFLKEELWLVSELVDRLPRKERRCLELCYLDGKTHREIADLLGLNQDTVSTIIRRTRERLKKKLLEKGFEG